MEKTDLMNEFHCESERFLKFMPKCILKTFSIVRKLYTYTYH